MKSKIAKLLFTLTLAFITLLSIDPVAFAAAEQGDIATIASQFTIPFVTVILVVAMVIAVGLFLRNYIKVPPNKAAVIYGRDHKIQIGDKTETVGSRIVRGGATFKWPILEGVEYLTLETMNIVVEVKNAITKEGVPLTVTTVANVKIGSDDECLRNAAERFLGMTEEKRKDIVLNTLEADLRAICGTLTVEEINNDRDNFNKKMTEAAAGDLRKMGVVIDKWAVQHIADAHGYLDSLGKKRTAEVQRDAAVGEAEAKKDKEIKTAEANRESIVKSSDAEREGSVAKANNDQKIAEAERALKIKQAEYEAEVQAAEARRDQAGPKAQAEAEKDVLVAQVKAKEARIEAETELQKKEALKNEEELKATVLKQAEAAKSKLVIEATASKEKATIDAEAAKSKLVIEATASKEKATIDAEAAKKKAELEAEAAVARADGQKKADTAIGEGEASKTKAVGLAEAEAEKAKLLAKAEGEAAQLKQKLLAEAEGELKLAEALKAKLLAEAEGKLKLAEAFKAMDEAGRTMFILQAAPSVIAAIGNAAREALTPAFNSVGAGLGNIDKVVIMENGGQPGDGVKGFAMQGPNLVFQILQQCRAFGIDPTNLLKKLGLDIVAEVGLNKSDTAVGTAVVSASTNTDSDKKKG